MNIAIAGVRHSHIISLAGLARSKPEYALTGWWEEDEEARSRAQALFPEPAYSSFDELLADPAVDIVGIGDYYGIRGRRILDALHAGKHVIADKPVCTSVQEAEDISSLSRRTGLKVACMLDLRYDPALRMAAEIIRGGSLGEIRSVAFTGQHPLSWGTRPAWYFEEGKHGGTFNDIAVHGLDAVRFITGLSYGNTLCARTWNAFAEHAPDFCDSAQLLGELENGASLMADVSYSAPDGAAFSLPSYWRFTFWGAKGWLECRLRDSRVMIALAGDSCPRILKAPPVERDYLDDLADEIHGRPVLFDTQSVLDSALTVLKIQLTADHYRKEHTL